MCYIFTFGMNSPLGGRFVRIEGTYSEARRRMFSLFGDKWAFQYSENDWNRFVNEAARKGKIIETEVGIDEAQKIMGIHKE